MPTFGANITLGQYAEIGPNAEIGDDCIVHGCVKGKIGNRTKVWRFAHVMEGAVMGDDCQVCNCAIVLATAVVGNRVDVQIGASVARFAVVEDNVFIGPGVIFCNAKRPYVGHPREKLQAITIKKGAVIGANSSLMAGVTVGEGAHVGAGTVVTKDVEPGTTVIMSARQQVLL